MIVLKLAAVPAVVWLASLAGRRWGHRVSGLIGGFPLIAAPIVLYLAMGGASGEFIADTAWTTMAVAPAVGVHCLVYGWMSRLSMPRRLHWVVCLACAWTACIIAEVILSGWVIKGPAGAALALGLASLASWLMPRVRGPVSIPHIPAVEIVVRMAAALVIAALIMLGAEFFGPRASGILLGFPVTSSVLPAFTLYLYGSDATIRLLSGFTIGLIGFVTYFFAFASLVLPLGAGWSFAAGVVASVATVSVALTWQRTRPGARQFSTRHGKPDEH